VETLLIELYREAPKGGKPCGNTFMSPPLFRHSEMFVFSKQDTVDIQGVELKLSRLQKGILLILSTFYFRDGRMILDFVPYVYVFCAYCSDLLKLQQNLPLGTGL